MNKKERIIQTDEDIIVSNLRCEVGEIVESWILWREFIIIKDKIRPEGLKALIENKEFNRIKIIAEKFKDDIISRLSELSEEKVGQITFHFAAKKFNILESEIMEFRKFIKKNNFNDRRNQYISHKTLPSSWDKIRAPHRIPYFTILRGIAFALILMKKIDIHHHGQGIKLQWIKMRKKRYDFTAPAKIDFMLLPYVRWEITNLG